MDDPVAGMNGQHFLVTGGAGFLGGHLVPALRARGAQVTIADRVAGAPSAEVSVRVVDLLEDDLEDLLAEGRYDGVFHLAGNAEVPLSVERPELDFRLNAGVTLRLLEALRKVSPAASFLLASTAAIYGEALDGPCRESQPADPVAPYGASKWMAESYTELYAREHGLRTRRARIFSMYGEGLRKHVVYDLIAKLAANPKRLEVLGDGGQVRDFLYVEDAVRALLAVQEHSPGQGEAVNVASGVPLTIRQLAQAVADAFGGSPEVAFGAAEAAGRSRSWMADVGRLRSLGFAPRHSLEDGLARTVAWYRETAAEAGA